MPDSDGSDRSPIYGTLAQGWQFYRRKGARLTEEQHPSVVDLIAAGEIDAAQYRGWHQFDKAHLVMLAEQGIIPLEAAARNLQALRKMEEEGYLEIRKEMGHAGHGGEAYLIRELGEEIAGWIHVGRSSGDLGPVGRRFLIRSKILETMDVALDLIEIYCDRAEEYVDAIMPTYTNGIPGSQHAQVGTFGWYLMALERPIERDFDRFVEAYDRVNLSPAGLAAGTTTDFPIDRERTAELLGFRDLLDNSEDGTHAGFDTTLEVANNLATFMSDVAKGADHVFLWYMKEFDLVDVPDEYLGTSSIMPHKANPHAVMGIQRAADGPIGTLMSAYSGSRNFGSHVRIGAETFDTVHDYVKTWTGIVDGLKFDRELGRKRIYLDWALITDLAGEMVRETDINWRWAHQITAILVRRAEEAGKGIRDITNEDIDAAAEEYLGKPIDLPKESVEKIIENPERALKDRNEIPGSPAPKQVKKQIQNSREKLTEGRETVQKLRDNIEKSEKALEQAIDDIIQEVDLED